MSDDDLHKHRHFVNEIEQAIRMANREVLHPVVNGMTDEDVIAVAVEVAKRRGAYLKATLELGHSEHKKPSGSELASLRNDYKESRDAFAELMHSIERGYIDVPAYSTK